MTHPAEADMDGGKKILFSFRMYFKSVYELHYFFCRLQKLHPHDIIKPVSLFLPSDFYRYLKVFFA